MSNIIPQFHTLEDILEYFPEEVELARYNADLDTDSPLYTALHALYEVEMVPDMRKARTGDPVDFICNELAKHNFWD